MLMGKIGACAPTFWSTSRKRESKPSWGESSRMGRDSNSEECGPGVQEKNEGVVVLTPRCTKIRMEFRPDNGFGLTYHPQGPLLLTGSSPPGGVDFLAILEAPASPGRGVAISVLPLQTDFFRAQVFLLSSDTPGTCTVGSYTSLMH